MGTKQFSLCQKLQNASKIHNNKYDYSKVVYVNYNTKVIVVCPDHGDFETNLYNHSISGTGCPKCSVAKIGIQDMKNRQELTQDVLKAIFDYREDGVFIWKVKLSLKTNVGTVAGYKNPSNGNRRYLQVNKKLFLFNRLVFFYHHGWWPENVDHIDRNPENDRIENLRAATYSQNSKNTSSKKGSTSRYLGVYYSKDRNKKWVARITINKKCIHIGSFNSENEAAMAWNEAAIINYGEFANLNTIE